MKYRIRFYLTLAAILPLMALSWNAGHTAGLRDMLDSYKRGEFEKVRRGMETVDQVTELRRMLCQLPVGGSVCVPRLPVRKPTTPPV